MKWTEKRMQYALTRAECLFDFRRYSVVPNVSWGLMLNHEADLLCLSKARVFHEVEIKVSKSDLKADKHKKNGHYNKFIRHLWFAIPVDIDSTLALEEIPDYAGLVTVESFEHRSKPGIGYFTKIIRRPRPKLRQGYFENPDQSIVEKFLRLGVMRMWSIKEKP